MLEPIFAGVLELKISTLQSKKYFRLENKLNSTEKHQLLLLFLITSESLIN